MKVFIVFLVSSLLISQALALPRKAKAKCQQATSDDSLDEDVECEEELMHPDLPDSETRYFRKIPGEETEAYWESKGIQKVGEKLAARPERGIAKNIVYFLGDGMSFTTISATRVYLGGEEQELAFETFTDTGLARTYAIDRLIPDSASTANALFSGAKSMYGTIGVNGYVKRGDCDAQRQRQNEIESIAKWALDAGKSVGIVTNMRVTDATPAGLYAHVADRDWESDKELSDACGKSSGIKDIALQLIEGYVGKRLSVVFGGGKKHFIDRDLYKSGNRRDGRNLIAEFSAQPGAKYVETKADFAKLSALQGYQRVMGLFDNGNLLYNLQNTDRAQPTLSELTAKAIELLSVNPKGYLLFVENGKIDVAHHKNKARMALDETAELNRAVALAKTKINFKDTLMVVTADHSHTMSIAGYAPRSNDIFGMPTLPADDGLPYMTLSYANGPSYKTFFDTKNSMRFDPSIKMLNQIDDIFPAIVPLAEETHDAEDVPVYAMGPWADVFSGVYEQSTVPHLIAYAACIGKGLKAC